MRTWTILFLLAAPLLIAQEDAKLLASLKAADYEGKPAVYAYDRTDVTVEESGLSHVVHKVLIKVLDGEGAKKFSALRFDYDPTSSLVEIRKVSVFHDGKEIPLDMNALADLPQPQFMIYWGPRMKLCDLPRLEPGDGIYYETYMKGFQIAYLEKDGDDKYTPPMRGTFYDQVIFGDELPMKEKSYTLHLPKDKPLNSEIYYGEVLAKSAFDDASVTYTWWKKDIPALEEEPRMVEWRDATTKLVLATVKDWPEKSRWFFHINDPQFDSNDEIKAKVREIIRPCADDECKIDALLHWTANNIRYSGVSMGKGEGYTLHTGIMDMHDRCGVCKDIAGTLVTLLRAAGFTAYPAMTYAGARVEQVPADQFNHCVVALKQKDGTYRMLDPTWCPFTMETWSSAEQNQNYVIGSPEGEQLMEIPTVPPEKNLVSITVEDALDAGGELKGTMTVYGQGFSDAGMRWMFVNDAMRNWQPSVERWITGIAPQARLGPWTISDMLDLKKPLTLTMHFTIPAYAWTLDNGLVFTPASFKAMTDNRRLAEFAAAVKSDKRKYDIFLRTTRDIRIEETLTLPPGYAMGTLPEKSTIRETAGSYTFAASQEKGKLKLSQEFIVAEKIIPAVQYAGFKKAADALLDKSDVFLTLRKEGK